MPAPRPGAVRHEGGVRRHDPGVACRPALQIPGLVDFAVVRPLAAYLGRGRVHPDFAPTGRRENGVLDAERDRFLGPEPGVVERREERCEPVAGARAGGDPGEQGSHLTRVEQGTLVDRAGGLRCGVLAPPLGQRVVREDVLANREAQGNVQDAAIAFGGACGGG